MTKKQLEKIHSIIEKYARMAVTPMGRNRINEFQVHCKGYAEPGYDAEGKPVVLGNWNTITAWDDVARKSDVLDAGPSDCANALKKAGAELEWCDEWIDCGMCGRLVRTSGNCYGWTQAYVEEDGEVTCRECICKTKKSRVAYLESMENLDRKAVIIDIDPEKHGYVRLPMDFENGLYGGQADDPKVIAESLRKMGVTRFFFRIDSVGQFDMDFSVYVHKSEIEKARSGVVKSAGADPAIAMRAALKEAPIAAAAVEKPGHVTMVKCHPDGTATAKAVPSQEFIEGTHE